MSMNMRADKAREGGNHQAASDVAHEHAASPYTDNRSTSAVQRKLQQMANGGPQADKVQQVQRMADQAHGHSGHVFQKKNDTGLPDRLKAGVEKLSGYSMDDVKVHYNSDKPRALQAHAYAQGTGIHLAPGKEKHLPHEAWHVVQQMQGRVKPTMQMKGGVPVNDDAGLEREADVMGARALASGHDETAQRLVDSGSLSDGGDACANRAGHEVVQRDAASDVIEARADIAKTTGYAGRVLEGVNAYSTKLEFAYKHKHTHSALDGAVNGAAGGLKAWASNYYNKSQAYLYEAQKANDHTRVEASDRIWHMARLGEDTDKDPDMQTLTIGHNEMGAEQSSRRSVELKTCTTAAEANVAKLVQAGLAQLQKREATGKFSSLLLTVHNDHPDNIYPYVEGDKNEPGADTMLTDTNRIEAKLITRINASKKGSGIRLPLEVRLEHRGARYATVYYSAGS